MIAMKPSLAIAALVGLGLVATACGGGAQPTPTAAPASPVLGATHTPAIGAATSTPGVGAPSATATVPPTQGEQPQRGGTIRMQVYTVYGRADPHQSRGMTGGADVQALLYNSLVNFDRLRGIPVPSLAESWEYKNPTELIVRLRKGVKFQEKSLAKGREMDSMDVALSLDRTRQPLPFIYAILQRNLDAVEVIDRYTVRLTFLKADANYLFYEAVPGGVLPKELIKKYGEQGTPMAAYNGTGPFSAAKYSATPCATEECWYGTGPFVVDVPAYRADLTGAADRNPDYWDPGRPYVDRVTWVSIGERSSRIAAIATGQLDLGGIYGPDKDRFVNLGFKIQTTEDQVVAGDHMALNNLVYPFNDWRVRKAANLVADKEEQMAIVNQNFGCINLWLGCNSKWFLSWKDKEFQGVLGIGVDMKTNIAEAKSLLKQAGVDPTAITLRVLNLPPSVHPTSYERPLTIVGQLEKHLGFKIEQKALPACLGCTTTESQRRSGFELRNVTAGGRGGVVVDAGAWETIHSRAANNPSLWNDPETDRLIEAQEGELDFQKRKALLQQLQRHLAKDGNIPNIIGARNFDYIAYNPKLRGWDGTGYFLNNYAWQFAWSWLEK